MIQVQNPLKPTFFNKICVKKERNKQKESAVGPFIQKINCSHLVDFNLMRALSTKVAQATREGQDCLHKTVPGLEGASY